MVSNPIKKLLVEATWFAGLATVLVVSVGATFAHLDSRRARVPRLEQEVERKEQSLREAQPSVHELAELEVSLAAAREMASAESKRVSALSTVARRSGVNLVAMRSLDSVRGEDESVVAYAHRVEAVGSYPQIARFLGAIHTAPGIVGIEELEIGRDEENVVDTLHATLRITWYAPADGASAGADSEEG